MAHREDCPVVFRTVRAIDEETRFPVGRLLLNSAASASLVFLLSCSKPAPDPAPAASTAPLPTDPADPAKPEPPPSEQVDESVHEAKKHWASSYSPNRYYEIPANPATPALQSPTKRVAYRQRYGIANLIDAPYPPKDVLRCYGHLGNVWFDPDSTVLGWDAHRVVANAGDIASYCGPGTLTFTAQADANDVETLADMRLRLEALRTLFDARRDLSLVKQSIVMKLIPSDILNSEYATVEQITLDFEPACPTSTRVLYSAGFDEDPANPSRLTDLVAALAKDKGVTVLGGFGATARRRSGVGLTPTQRRDSGPPQALNPNNVIGTPSYIRTARAVLADAETNLRAVPMLEAEPILKRDYGPNCLSLEGSTRVEIFTEADSDPFRVYIDPVVPEATGAPQGPASGE